MKCPRCKKQLRKGAKFCPACGARVEKKRGIRFTSILLVIVLLLIIVAIGWSGGILFAKYFGGNFKDLFSRKETIEIHNVEEAIAHAKWFGEELGYENALSELTEKALTTVDGDNYYRLQQNYQGIPVYGRTVVYSVDNSGSVLSITGSVLDIDDTLSLTPTVSVEQVSEAINRYLHYELGYEDFVSISIPELSGKDLCIYKSDVSYEANLAYNITIGSYTFVVSAQQPVNVLFADNLLRTASVVSSNLSGQTQTYTNVIHKQENGTSYLVDSEKKIETYNIPNNTEWKWSQGWNNMYYLEKITVMDESKDLQLISWQENGRPGTSAVDAYKNSQIAFDYFSEVLKNKSTDGSGNAKVHLLIGIEWAKDDKGKYQSYIENAASSTEYDDDGTPITYLWFNKENEDYISFSAYLDIVAHEYMHSVEAQHSGMVYKGESGAIMEGLSDIFGELVEAWHDKKNPNWLHGDSEGRNLQDPNNSENPSTYNGLYWDDTNEMNNDNGGVHKNSTVISHAAYLMWHGGVFLDSDKRISETELATLWYRAMLMMPSDCNFIECRTIVELAASTMNLTDLQKQCVCEAFDAVGIPRASEEEYSQLVHLDTNGVTSIKGTIYEVRTENGIETVVPVPKATMTVYSSNSTKAHKKLNMKNEKGFFEIELPAGTYSVVITADGYIGQTISFELADNEVRYFSVELELSDNKTENNTDAYSAYLNATQKTMASGSWSEHLIVTANMAITDGSAKTKTKVTLTSDADVSNYSESDPSQIRMSGSAEMTVMGQTYAWNLEYENGTAHYRYTKPNQTSADKKIDPSFFNFGTMTSDMMTDAKLSGNKITFTVPGEKIAEVGIAAVNQMSGVDNLEYGDVNVTVTISNEGKIDNIVMVFHASLEYQGYNADVDYNIDYRFSESSEKPNKSASSDIGDLQEYLDFSKSWGIRKDVTNDPQFPMEQIFDFAFMKDGTFYCYFYQQYTDFMDGFYGTYLFEDDQIKFYFENDDGTSTLYAYSFDPDAMKLSQVSEKGIWGTPVGTVYSLKNDEWLPAAQEVINSAKRAIDNKGMELGG